MMYYLNLRDEQYDVDVTLDVDTLDEARAAIPDEAEDWCKAGEWGIDGASIDIWWTIYADVVHEEPLEDGACTIEIEPDHESLIEAAGGDTDCDHKWSSEGEGGCDENPGVWSTGGTSMMFVSHCTRCGLLRTEHHIGSQRNPGEHDTIEYKQPN